MFEVADGFEVNLFAESPMLAKPIQINFDPQGRLWIASSSVYPQIQPGQPADDKVVVLEDKDRDGYAEKSTVFADGLLIPTGVAPGDGGVYVGQSTELLHFKDNDGDGKADQRRVVLSGFGTEDTHHIVHTLRWGQDGQLYFNQSIYIHSHIETPHGVRRLNSGGVWHLRPPTLELGVYLKGFCNPWGHEFDHFGQSFVTDGAGFQGVSFSIPGATYFTYANMRRELKSISPGNYPKFCGLEIVRSRHFPEDWQGNAVTCDFRAHRIVRFGIEEQGSGYVTRALPDLLRTTNVAFRPIDVKLGPDGALYIADWSNPIIQHGEVDFRDPRRDHEQGRIWRVSTKGRPLVKSPNFGSLNNLQLLEFTASPNAYEQQQARRVLHERGHAIQKDLARWTQSQQGSFALLEALWLYQGIDNVEPGLLQKVLRSNDGRVRAAAVRVLSFWHSRVRDPVGLLAERIVDEHPRVRLEAMRALAQIPGTRSAELVLSALERPMDPFLDYGLWLSINDLAPSWVAAVKSGEWKIAGREKQLEFALGAIQPELAAEVLGLVLPDKIFPRDGAGRWIELVGSAGNQPQLNRLFAQTIEGGFDGVASVRALQALNEAARKRSMKPSGSLAGLTSLFQNSNADVQEQAIRLAGSWKLKQSVPTLLKLISAESTPDRVRGAGFDALREIGGSDVMAGVLPLTTKAQPAATRRQAILCLAALDLDQATPKAVELLAETTNENDALDFWRSLLGIKGAGSKLAPALPKADLPAVMAKTGLRAAREGGRNEPELVWALTRGANLEEQTLTAAELQQLATRVTSDGNPARGENVFRRKELACFTCHAIGGVGGKVGPDLTSIGTSAQPDYLIESMLYPNRKIKEGYHSVIVETKDSMEFSGVLVRENSDELVLRDATDREMTIAKKNVQNRTTGNSLMPSGLLDLLNPQERLDLFRFLSELGKPGAYDASKGNVARSWKLLVETHELAQFGEERVLATAFDDPKWTPARTLVDGRLLRSELVAALEPFERRSPQAVYLAARFEVASAGPVSFQAAGADGALAWIDGKRVGTCSDLKLPLEAGAHTILVRVETKKLPDSIRLHSPEAVFIGNWK